MIKPIGGQLTFLVVAGLFSVIYFWASEFEVDQVVRAEAKVVPVKDVVKVQNRYPGAVEDVLVNLGATVKKGQVLFRIDPEEAEIDLIQTKLALNTQVAIAARLDAQINSHQPVYPPGAPREIVKTQDLVLHAKRAELASRSYLVESEIDALNLNITEANATAAAARRQAELTQEEIDLLEPLVKSGASSRLQLVQSYKALNDLIERIEVSDIRAKRLEVDMESKRRTLAQETANYYLLAREQLAEVQTEVSRLRGELERADDRRSKSEVVSPIDGVVTALPFAVVGQIADSGMILAELVPSDTTYKVEAKIKPIDVTNVKIGQVARLSLMAYDFADYGHIEVVVKEVAQNLTEPQQAEPYYSSELSIDFAAFSKSGDPVELMPGLMGQIDILGDPVTIIDYITKPINRVSSRALREK